MKYLSLLAIAFLTFASCSGNDDFDGEIIPTELPPTFDNTALGQKQKQFFDTYNVWFKTDYPLEEVTYDWNTIVEVKEAGVALFRYTNPDKDYAEDAMDYIKTHVFDVLGTEFIREKMPLKILLADTVRYLNTNGTNNMWTGMIKYNYMMYGNVAPRFDDLKITRDQAMYTLSLFVEKIVNAGNILVPSEFSGYSEAGYALTFISNAADAVALYAFLRKGKEGQKSGTNHDKMLVQQDFGDYVGFIVYVPDDVKETFYAKNSLVKLKENAVRNFFLQTYGITLPYKPIY